jgi:hypothetical protein
MDDLPNELLVYVWKHLSCADSCMMAGTCRRMRRLFLEHVRQKVNDRRAAMLGWVFETPKLRVVRHDEIFSEFGGVVLARLSPNPRERKLVVQFNTPFSEVSVDTLRFDHEKFKESVKYFLRVKRWDCRCEAAAWVCGHRQFFYRFSVDIPTTKRKRLDFMERFWSLLVWGREIKVKI